MIKPIEYLSIWTVVITQVFCIAVALSSGGIEEEKSEQKEEKETPEAIVEIEWDQVEYEYIPAEVK